LGVTLNRQVLPFRLICGSRMQSLQMMARCVSGSLIL
jgi:hypothetical protein